MRVYLARHGKAEQHSATGLDEDRELKARGERQAAWLGAWLREAEVPPARALASPAARAWATAEAIGTALGLEVEREDRVSLAASVSDGVEAIESCAGLGAVVLVGHNPTMSGLVVRLLREPGAARGLSLRTGEMAVVDLDPEGAAGGGVLVSVARLEE